MRVRNVVTAATTEYVRILDDAPLIRWASMWPASPEICGGVRLYAVPSVSKVSQDTPNIIICAALDIRAPHEYIGRVLRNFCNAWHFTHPLALPSVSVRSHAPRPSADVLVLMPRQKERRWARGKAELMTSAHSALRKTDSVGKLAGALSVSDLCWCKHCTLMITQSGY